MATVSPSLPAGRRPGWYIPWLFVAMFAVVVAVNAFMIYSALTTFNGLETENHFVKGIHYNDDLAGARAQAQRGWQVGLAVEPAGLHTVRVAVEVMDKAGRPLSGSRARVSFIRPTMQGFDREQVLAEAGEGRFASTVELPLAGVWDVRLQIDHPTGDYQDRRRVRID
jgi:nitrogen fixation protein FixH